MRVPIIGSLLYLYGRHFTIHSDHQPLKHIFGDKKGIPLMAASRIQRWALTLSAYEYTIEYCPGKKLQNADALSRLPLNRETHVPIPGDIRHLQEHLNTRSPVTADQISVDREGPYTLTGLEVHTERMASLSGWRGTATLCETQDRAERPQRMHTLGLTGGNPKNQAEKQWWKSSMGGTRA